MAARRTSALKPEISAASAPASLAACCCCTFSTKTRLRVWGCQHLICISVDSISCIVWLESSSTRAGCCWEIFSRACDSLSTCPTISISGIVLSRVCKPSRMRPGLAISKRDTVSVTRLYLSLTWIELRVCEFGRSIFVGVVGFEAAYNTNKTISNLY